MDEEDDDDGDLGLLRSFFFELNGNQLQEAHETTPELRMSQNLWTNYDQMTSFRAKN